MYIYQSMSNSFGYIDIILLAMIAGFIILRLRNILGRKTGNETKIYPNFADRKFTVPKSTAKSFKQNHEVLEGNEKKEFLQGAEIAYETILTSFANGDDKKLKSLLTSNMASNFVDAIDLRNKENKIIEGNPDKIKQVVDYWKFTRNILNKSPNWYLSEIVSK